MKTLLFTAHTPSENTEKLATICAAEMQSCSDNVTLIHKAPLETVSADGLNCDGLVIATTENIGYMAGLTKDMFDRCYNDWLYLTDGLPVAFYIRAGLDGTATATTLSRFAHALRWRMVRPPLILKGDYIKDFETQAAELGGGFAAGLEAGIF
ncbi:MAG: flavodoxin family protein [Candidatus Puniceispirillaceae bacterium]